MDIVEIRKKYKLIKKCNSDEEVVDVLDDIIRAFNEETEDWSKWKLAEFVRTCEDNKKKYPVCHEYAMQFMKFIMDGYLSLPEEYKTVEQFENIVTACAAFKSIFNPLFVSLFMSDEWQSEWFVNKPEDLPDTVVSINPWNKENKIVQEQPNERFLAMMAFLQTGQNGKNISRLNRVIEMCKTLEMFPSLEEKRKMIMKAAETPLTCKENIYLYEHGRLDFFFRCPIRYIKKKWFEFNDDDRPKEGWEYMLESDNPGTITFCIQYIMPLTVAATHKKLKKNVLAKIFHYKRCQTALIESEYFTYAMPEIIEFAGNREFTDTLCMELKQMLGYDTGRNEEEKKENLIAM